MIKATGSEKRENHLKSGMYTQIQFILHKPIILIAPFRKIDSR